MEGLKHYQASKNLILIGLIVWVVETAYFLIIEGWHWEATSPDEIFWDKVVSVIWLGGILCLVSATMCMVDAYYKGKLRTKINIKTSLPKYPNQTPPPLNTYKDEVI